MKKLFLLLAFVAVGAFTNSAMAYMSSSEVRIESDFLTDKMVYELDLNAAQAEAVYEINYDFFDNAGLVIDGVVDGRERSIYTYDKYLDERCEDLSYVLNSYQYDRMLQRDYFLNPIHIAPFNGYTFGVHIIYTNPNYYYYDYRGRFYSYRGTHNRRYYSRNNRSYYAYTVGRNGNHFFSGTAANHRYEYRRSSVDRSYKPNYQGRDYNYNDNNYYNHYKNNNNSTNRNGNHFSIGNGVTPNYKNNNSNGNNRGNRVSLFGSRRRNNNNNTGIGSGATPSRNTGIGSGAAPSRNTGIGSGAAPSNTGIGNGATPSNTGIGNGVTIEQHTGRAMDE